MLSHANETEASLQLLLFVDKRPHSAERIRQVRHCLKELGKEYPFDLKVIDVSEQPHLAEHFKLVATPTLIKLHPAPRHVLAGSDLVAQLGKWWQRWQKAADDFKEEKEHQQSSDPDENQPIDPAKPSSAMNSVIYSAELMRLSDEIFRLRQEKEQLQEQLQFKDRLIAMLAHDLRNPLTAVSIALDTLEMGNSTENEEDSETTSQFQLTPALTAQLLKHARTQTKAIDRMITDILQMARGRGTQMQIQPHDLDLGRLCMSVLDRLSQQFQDKSQSIETDIPNDLPSVYADSERVQQVLVNLLDNATKYTPEGGTVQLTILHRTTQKVQISVCDTGPGIPEENKNLIFEDQFRLERDEKKDGYGIGLALCKRVILAHYGQIWVDSTMGQGSCFHFTLPVYR